MAVDPATLKVLAKLATTAASDERVRRVILIACLTPFLLILLVLSSPFAIFFSVLQSDSSDVAKSVNEIIYDLQAEFKGTVESERIDEDVDEVKVIIMGSEENTLIDNSADVLISFAVKYNMVDDQAEQVASLEEKQVKKLKQVFWDMNMISIEVKDIEITTTEKVQNDDGEWIEIEKTSKRNVKYVHVDSLTFNDAVHFYGFSDKQIKVGKEMQSSGLFLYQNANIKLYLTSTEIAAIKSKLPNGLILNRDSIVESAKSIEGKVHYFWGGKSLELGWDNRWGTPMEVASVGSPSTGTTRPFGLDCSGFITWVFANQGLDLTTIEETIGHGTTNQWNLSSHINKYDVKKGDLAILAIPGTRKVNHIGIVVEKDGEDIYVIHCASGPNNVVITKADETGFLYFRRPAILMENGR